MAQFTFYLFLVAFLVTILSVTAAPAGDLEARRGRNRPDAAASTPAAQPDSGVAAAAAADPPAPAPAPDQGEYSGRGTWFETGLGACGHYNSDSDHIVAVSLSSTYDGGANCDRTVTITANGNTATATVVDACESCGPSDLDMTPSLFEVFGPLSLGVLQIVWSFN